MWQRFTERARKMVFFAQEEAAKLGENFVGTEHLLLGLLRQEDHVASLILLKMQVDLQAVRAEVLRQVTAGEGNKPGSNMELTPRAKRVIDFSYDEARRLSNNYIGTEHLLLGLLREGEGIAGRVLHNAGVDLETTRSETRLLQDGSPPKGVTPDTLPAERGFRPLVVEVKPLQPTKGEAYHISQPREETENYSPGRGDIGALGNVDGRKNVEFVLDAADLPAFTEAMSLKDEFAYRDLIAEGKLLLLKAGTGAKFLRMETPDVCRIRILDGDHAGRIGFVLRHQLPVTCKDYRPFPPDIA